jgi:phage terminase small subunit
MSDQPAARKLTRKELKFIDEYLRDFNAARAARDAGYSKRTARQIGSENLTKPDILAEIDRRLPSETEIAALLSDHMRGDMGDFLDINSMSFDISLPKAQELGKTKLIKRVKQRTVTTVSKDGEEREESNIEIELYDAQAAAVHLGKWRGMFVDRQAVEHSGELKIEFIEVDSVTGDANDASE